MMVETVLVTGGTGFVASWCIKDLLVRGYAVRASVRNLSKEMALREAVVPAGTGDRLSLVVTDLMDDEGWDEAMAGCDYVLHVASPLGHGGAESAETLVGPAREGTLRVLKAAVKARVKRVVMTSAAAAARPPRGSDRISDETIWADAADPKLDAYRMSKILAECAAWDFMAKSGGTTELATILPSAVFGPLLMRDSLGSVRVIDGLLQGRPPGIPNLGFWIVDVRDLADAHIKAMIEPEAAGERFIVAGDFLWLHEVADVLRSLDGAGRKVPTRRLPDFVVRLLSLFLPQLRMFTPDLGKRNALSSAKARAILGFAPRPASETVLECGKSLQGSASARERG